MEQQKDIFDSASGRILRYVLEHSQVTVKEIEVGLQVTRNAVRVQIDQLESQGLLDSKLIHSDRGRPYRVYFVTDKGREALPNDYKNLAKFLWQQIIQNTAPEHRDEVLNKIGSLMAEDFKGKITGVTVEERMQKFVKMLNEQGIPTQISDNGKINTWVEYNCPYYSVAKDNPSVCEMELEMIQQVLGSPVERKEWMLDGAPGCQFKVGKSDK